MKGNRFKVVLVFAVLALQVFGASAQSDVIDQIKESIKAGSAKELSKYLNQTVDVTIDGKLQSYSKPQAEFVFRDFFKQHVPEQFTITHNGSSRGGQLYAIGLYTSGGESFNVFMKVKSVNNQQLLHEISFAKAAGQ